MIVIVTVTNTSILFYQFVLVFICVTLTIPIIFNNYYYRFNTYTTIKKNKQEDNYFHQNRT